MTFKVKDGIKIGSQLVLDATGKLLTSAATADKLTTPRTLTAQGDLTGSFLFDGSQNIIGVFSVVDDSHTHDLRYYSKAQVDAFFAEHNQSILGGSIELMKSGSNPSGNQGGVQGSVAFIANDTAFPNQSVELVHDHFDTSLPTPGSGFRIRGTGTNPDPAMLVVEGKVFAFDNKEVYTDLFHPEADKLSNARTISLTGDVTGSVAFDGSGNVSMTTVLAADPFDETLYYQKTEADNRYLNKTTGGTIAGDVVISGNLTVNGTTQEINSTVVNVTDPVITLGADTVTNDGKDRGIEFKYHNGTVVKTGFFGFDSTDGAMMFIPDATNASEVFSGTLGNIKATSFIGNASTATKLLTARTIALTGDATGSISFDGSSNQTITVAVTDDSHLHDTRYYTKTQVDANTYTRAQSDANYVNVTGDSMPGILNFGTGGLTGDVRAQRFTLTQPRLTDGPWEFGVSDIGAVSSFFVDYGLTENAFRIQNNGGVFTAFVNESPIMTQANDGAGSGFDADLLDGQQGAYYLDYTNATNKPTIGDGVLTINTSGVGLSGSGGFSANQTGAQTITISSNATSANTASTLVARDASGNFSVGTITGALSGNATTATTLQTPRTINTVSFNGSANIVVDPLIDSDEATNAAQYITFVSSSAGGHQRLKEDMGLTYNPSTNTLTVANVAGNAATATKLLTARTISLTGDVTGSVSFDGSANVSIAATVAPNSVALGTDTTGDYIAAGAVSGNGLSGSATGEGSTFTVTSNATAANTPSTGVFRDASGNFAASVITAALSGNASSATQLATPRTINGVAFDGTANITLPALADSVTLGTHTVGNYVAAITNGSYITGANGGSEGASLTLAVDATSANTASKVVARDASGNFAAGVITAALSGNASTATTLQTARTINGVSFNGSANISVNTVNALTFNNGGAGAASGQTFNGGAAATISYNTIGAPSTTGANASGTWAIDITGSASFAANFNGELGGGVDLNTFQTTGYWHQDANAEVATGTNYPNGSAGLLKVYGNGAYKYQQYQTYDGNTFAFRTLYNGSWSSWKDTLHSGNFNAYAPTLTGVGASGTWAINISGNAETVDGFSASQSTVGNAIVVRDPNGYVFGNYINMTDDGNPGGGTAISSFITKQGDNYYRSVSPSNAMVSIRGVASGSWGISVTGTAGNLSSTRSNWASVGVVSAVVGQLAWKNYGNNHTIFDASAGTSPDGGAVNNTNAAVAWSATYPTLMGWNGSSTYGVRVDSARVADSASVATTVGITASATNASYPLVFSPSAASGNHALMVDNSGGTYNPSTNTATMNIIGNASTATSASSASSATSAGSATNIAITNDGSTNTSYPILFASTTPGSTLSNQQVKNASNLFYNPSTSSLITSQVSANVLTCTTLNHNGVESGSTPTYVLGSTSGNSVSKITISGLNNALTNLASVSKRTEFSTGGGSNTVSLTDGPSKSFMVIGRATLNFYGYPVLVAVNNGSDLNTYNTFTYAAGTTTVTSTSTGAQPTFFPSTLGAFGTGYDNMSFVAFISPYGSDMTSGGACISYTSTHNYNGAVYNVNGSIVPVSNGVPITNIRFQNNSFSAGAFNYSIWSLK